MHPLLISYLYYFNMKADYYECHEYGEVLWLESGRPTVLKGLIQAAVCLYHLYNGNCKGAVAMWHRVQKYLSPSRPVYEAIDLDALLIDLNEVFSRVPTQWHQSIVPVEKIEELKLPTVKIHILDKSVEEALPTWEPVHLDR